MTATQGAFSAETSGILKSPFLFLASTINSPLVVTLGGRPLTFSGLAGMGDLIATCSSHQSRNRHVGEQLAKGRTLQEIVDDMRMVAEGVKTPIVNRGFIDVPDRPGLGVTLNEDVVRQHLAPNTSYFDPTPEWDHERSWDRLWS